MGGGPTTLWHHTILTSPRCWSSRLHAEPTPSESMRRQVLCSLMISQKQIALWVSRAAVPSHYLRPFSLCNLKLCDLIYCCISSCDITWHVPHDLTWHHMTHMTRPTWSHDITWHVPHDLTWHVPHDPTWHHMTSGVKQVPIEHLLEDKTYIFFSHTIKAQPENMPLLDAMLQKVKLMGQKVKEGR